MSKIRSGQYKSRNLPKDYKVVDQVKSKPISMLIVMIVVGATLIFQDKYFLMGIVIFGFSSYHLFFIKNQSMIEFSDDFVVFYLDETKEDCCVLYYNEIKDYTYKVKKFDTDMITIHLIDGKPIVLKSLDRKKVCRNFENHGVKDNVS